MEKNGTSKTAVYLLCATIMLGCALSCARFRGGASVQDGDCIPPEAMANLKLIMASAEGDTEKMRALIKAGADVNTSDDLFGTPMVAAVSVNIEAVKLLLDKGANVNATDPSGCPVLIVAALLHREEVVRLLVSRGADVNASCYPLVHGKRPGKMTVLKAAQNSEALVKFLTHAGAKE